MKNTKGITLIALVITIVVLIILAGVSINLLLGQNGIIRKAQQAKSDMANAQVYEEEQLNTLDEYMNKLEGGNTPDSVVPVPEDWINIKEIKEEVPIPKNFYYVGGTIDTGVIISDNAADENKGESYEVSKTLVGNQFVWIPVPLEEGETFESKYPRTIFEFETNAPTTGLDNAYTEPYTDGYTTETAEYNAMINSVNKYKGFYVGRYESGCSTLRTDENKTTAQTVMIKQGSYVYNYVTWGASMNSTAACEGITGAVELSKNLGYTTVNSTLIYGIQWDMMLRYISDTNNVTDSSSWGNYMNATGDAAVNSGNNNMNYTTGRNAAWSAKNMYDVAANIREWTNEALSYDNRINRGGDFLSYGSHRSASNRYSNYPSNGYDDLGFRCALYL